MNLIEQIKADREAGTPGPWAYRPEKFDDWGTVRAGRYHICQARDPARMDEDLLSECRRNKIDPWEANARRIARVPEMEAALIADAAKLQAAYELAMAVSHEREKQAFYFSDPTPASERDWYEAIDASATALAAFRALVPEAGQ